MQTVYLSRRNLETLLSKLNRKANGEQTTCTIVKTQGPATEAFRQSMKAVAIVAVDNDEYYGAQQRPAGVVHDADEPNVSAPNNGVETTPL